MNKKRNKKQMSKAEKSSEVIFTQNYDQNEDNESSDFQLKTQFTNESASNKVHEIKKYKHKSSFEAI